MSYNNATEIVVDWLVKNEPNAQFYSSSDAKASIALKLGTSLIHMNLKHSTDETRDSLILIALREVDWDYIYSKYQKENSDINWQTVSIYNWLIRQKISVSGLNAEEIKGLVKIRLAMSSTIPTDLASNTHRLSELLENVQWEKLVVKEDVS